MTAFPQFRLRRLRRTDSLRALVRENHVEVTDLVYPMFIVEGSDIRQEITSMPGVFRYSPDALVPEIEELAELKIPAVLLFGIPEHKNEVGSSAYHPEGVVQQAIRVFKKAVPELLVITDVCLCEYTSHGHCGILADGQVDNDQTLLVEGIDLQDRWQSSFWDALILAAARRARAGVIWSEDFSTTQDYDGIVVVNPLI